MCNKQGWVKGPMLEHVCQRSNEKNIRIKVDSSSRISKPRSYLYEPASRCDLVLGCTRGILKQDEYSEDASGSCQLFCSSWLRLKEQRATDSKNKKGFPSFRSEADHSSSPH